MRFLKIFEQRLDEGRKRAQEMFAPVIKALGDICKDVESSHRYFDKVKSDAQWVEANTKGWRQDRAQWFIRMARVEILDRMFIYSGQFGDNQDELEVKERAWALRDRYADQLAKQCGMSNEGPSFISTIPRVHELHSSLEHFFGLPYRPIQNYVFANQPWPQINQELKALEEEFKEKAAGMVYMEEGDQIILDFPAEDGEPHYCWILLNRASCSKEAAAMGHCGNSPRRGSTDRIISLRQAEAEFEGVQYYRPCLTFILHEDGYLGEMKGRANEKPAQRYHRYIEALLHMDVIKGIRGGGYAPERNFALADMGGEKAREMLTAKPTLGHINDRLEAFGVTKQILEFLVNTARAEKLDPRLALKGMGVAPQFIPKIENACPFFSETFRAAYDNLVWKEFVDYTKCVFADKQMNAPAARKEIADAISDQQLKRLAEEVPEVLSVAVSYRLFGFTPQLEEQIAEAIADVGIYRAFDAWNRRFGLAMHGVDLWTFKEDELRGMFQQYPEAVDGLLAEIIRDGAEAHEDDIRDFVNNNGVVEATTKLQLDDAPSWFIKDVKKACSLFEKASTLLSYATDGDAEQISFPFMGHERAWADFQKLVEVNFRHSYNNVPEWNEEAQVFVTVQTTVADLIETYGDENAKNYWPPEEQIEHYTEHTDPSNSVDTLPLAMKLEIRKIAYEHKETHTGDMEAFEDFSITDAVNWLEDEGDDEFEIVQALRIAETSSSEAGAVDEAENAFNSMLKSPNDLDYGYLEFRSDDDKPWLHEAEYVAREDEQVRHVVTAAEMAKFLDSLGGDGLGESVFTFSLNLKVPYYGFSGSDDDAFVTSFVETVETDRFDSIKSNPYREYVVANMKDKQVAKALKEVTELILAAGGRDYHRDTDPRVTLVAKAKQYYGE